MVLNVNSSYIHLVVGKYNTQSMNNYTCTYMHMYMQLGTA